MLAFEKDDERTACNNCGNDCKIEQVNKLVYLGSMFTKSGQIDKEIKKENESERKIFGELNNICLISSKF